MKHQVSAKENPVIQTIDGPPLDFSFKSIRGLIQLVDNITTLKKNTQTTSAIDLTKTISFQPTQPESNASSGTKPRPSSKNNQYLEKEQKDQGQSKLQIIRTIETTDNHFLETGQKKVVVQKSKVEKKQKKIISPQTTALFLRYNKITSINNFNQFVEPVFPNPVYNLFWVDLSHNRLTQLSSDLGQLKNLKTLYLHANYISSFNELQKVKKAQLLITLTIHANPLQNFEQFRIIIHGILPGLKKIDSTLLTKRQTQRAQIIAKTTKKYPVIKNPKKPPEQSENEDEDD